VIEPDGVALVEESLICSGPPAPVGSSPMVALRSCSVVVTIMVAGNPLCRLGFPLVGSARKAALAEN